MQSNQPKLVFDIETIGEEYDGLDKTTQDVLTHWIEREAKNEKEYDALLEDLKNGLGFSPLTGEVVAVGVLDADKDKGGVYYQSPGIKQEKLEEEGITFEAMDEEKILRKFWDIASKYEVFITYNGRGFDVPFLMVRSAVHKVPPTKNLMDGRYLYQQKSGSQHIDLQDQLTFYGSVRKKGGLHLWCRAFGIDSPKSGGVTGDDVSGLFKEKKFLDIAKYNVRDIVATKELYDVWNTYFRS
jgi:3'-5' exonuclease